MVPDAPYSSIDVRGCGRRLLFDVGASFYSGWGYDQTVVGSAWLVSRYGKYAGRLCFFFPWLFESMKNARKTRNFSRYNQSFDHIYAFENVL